METEKPIRIYPVELIFAVALIGGIIVYLAVFRQIWDEDGLITGIFHGWRLLTVLLAAALGFALGWMTFPRIPFLRSRND